MVNVRAELLDCPKLVIRLRDESGEFANDVWKSGQCANVLPPGIQLASPNPGLAGVIENKLRLRAAAHEFDHRGQHGMFAADIKVQPGSGQCFDTCDELGTAAVVR